MEIGQFMWSSQTVVLPERDESLEGIYVITLGRTRKVTPRHRGTRVAGAGGGGGWKPSPGFLICCSIYKRFYLYWKAFDLLNKMRYISWVVALLEACDVTNNGRYPGRHLGFNQELEIRLKPREMVIFLCVT